MPLLFNPARVMQNLPEGRQGQWSAFALLCLAVLLFWMCLPGPLLRIYIDRAHHIEMQEQTVERMRHLKDILPHLRDTASRLPEGRNQLIDGASDAIASAKLQDRLQQIAQSNGTEFASSETLATTQEKQFRRIGLHVTFSAPYASLVHFLTAIETASPTMVIDGLHLHAAEAESTSPDIVTCEITILAYRRTSGKPSGNHEP